MTTLRVGFGWTVRRAVAADAAALALVGAATFLETYAPLIDGADIVAQCAAQQRVEGYAGWVEAADSTVFLAESETGAPVGLAVMMPPSPEINGPAVREGDRELKRIYVLSPWQGSGLGAALMAHGVEEARACGARRVLVGVLGRNLRAIAFYRRQSFVEVGTRRFLVGRHWHDDLVLALPI